jgi:hypothetical protein
MGVMIRVLHTHLFMCAGAVRVVLLLCALQVPFD